MLDLITHKKDCLISIWRTCPEYLFKYTIFPSYRKLLYVKSYLNACPAFNQAGRGCPDFRNQLLAQNGTQDVPSFSNEREALRVLAYLRSTKTVASSTGMCRRSSTRVAGVFGASTPRWDEADARWRCAWAWRGQGLGPPCREPAPRLDAAASGACCRAGSPRGAWSPLPRQFAGGRDLRRWPTALRELSRWLVRRSSHRRLMAGRTHGGRFCTGKYTT